MNKDDKLKCLETVNNVFDKPLFIKDEIYTVLYVDGDDVVVNYYPVVVSLNITKIMIPNSLMKKNSILMKEKNGTV